MFEYRNEEKIDVYCYLIKPESLNSEKRIKSYDETAQRAIKEMQDAIKNLNTYRQQLFGRYNDIYNASYTMQLKIKRTYDCCNKRVTFSVTVSKVYDRADIAEEYILKETYNGQERHNALKRFDALKKQYPNITAIKEIEKGKWEK